MLRDARAGETLRQRRALHRAAHATALPLRTGDVVVFPGFVSYRLRTGPGGGGATVLAYEVPGRALGLSEAPWDNLKEVGATYEPEIPVPVRPISHTDVAATPVPEEDEEGEGEEGRW